MPSQFVFLEDFDGSRIQRENFVARTGRMNWTDKWHLLDLYLQIGLIFFEEQIDLKI